MPFLCHVEIDARFQNTMPRVLHKEIEPSPIYFRDTAMLQLRDIAVRPDMEIRPNDSETHLCRT